jgi:hypothetical protein
LATDPFKTSPDTLAQTFLAFAEAGKAFADAVARIPLISDSPSTGGATPATFRFRPGIFTAES